MTTLISRVALLALGFGSLSLSSCTLARSLIQVPGRTLQSVGRTVGLGLEVTEITEGQKEEAPLNKAR